MDKHSKSVGDSIKNYRRNSATRRESSILTEVDGGHAAGPSVDGVLTVTVSANAVTIRSLGGATEVLGESHFSIPELHLRDP